MEDPITFDLWVTVAPDKKSEAKRLLQKAQPALSRLALLQMIARSVAADTPLLLVRDIGWSEVQQWKVEGGALGVIETYQAGYGPSLRHRMQKCQVHSVCYGGCLGCPVCNGSHRH